MILDFDIGARSAKAVLLDGDDRVVALAEQALAVSRRGPSGRAEPRGTGGRRQSPPPDALHAARPKDLAAVAGIGLSGQMHGATLLDAAGKVLSPLHLWNDGRTGAECGGLEAKFPELRQVTGNLAMPGFTAPKLLWVDRHEPDMFAKIAMVLLPSLCGRDRRRGDVEDMSDVGHIVARPGPSRRSDAAPP